MPKKREEDPSYSESIKRLKLYLYVVAVAALLAVIITLLPRGSQLRQCLGIILHNQEQLCVYNLAVSSGNASVCSHLDGSLSSSCYLTLAEKNRNASLCQSVFASNQSLGASCVIGIANATLRASLCGSITEPYSSSCYLLIALNSLNASVCARIGNLTSKTICVSTVDTDLALRSKNPSLCALVSNSTNKSIATGTYTGINQKLLSSTNSTSLLLLSYLVNIPSFNASARDLCYLFIAGSTQNSNYCSSISYAQLSNACSASYGNVTRSRSNFTKVLAGCYNETQQYKTLCIQSVVISEAIATKNATLCSKYFTPPVLWQCYSSLAQNYKNSTYCSYIANSTINSACLSSINYNSTRH